MRIERHTDEVLEEINAQANAILFFAAPLIVKSAKRISPIDTGLLRRSIQANIDTNEHVLTVGSQVPYAGYVEFGTPKMPAQPYLLPALLENLPEIERMFKRIQR